MSVRAIKQGAIDFLTKPVHDSDLIAAELGTAEKTIKVHRAHLMKKLKAGSLADLVKLAERLGVISTLPD